MSCSAFAESLRKAAKLYEKSYRIQTQCRASGSNILYSLAVVNNLGIVHEKLDDDESKVRCFDQLLSMLMCVTVNGGSETSELLEGFYGNAALSTQRFAPARAA